MSTSNQSYGNVTQRVIEHCVTLRPDDLSDDVRLAARIQILDCLGVGLAGAASDGVRELISLVREWGGAAQASVLGHDLLVPVPLAAQVNASMMHALDFDDAHGRGLMHPGVIAVPTALAVAQGVGGVSGSELLTAVALGSDLACRLGMAVRTSSNRAVTGWHYTSVFGAIASAATAGRLLRLSRDQLSNALGIAYHQSAGNIQSVIDGALTKRLGPGFAVRNGITAALLAQRGVTGAAGWLEGELGFYRLYTREGFDADILLHGLGRHFEGTKVAIKRYPCCGIVHPFIDAALVLRRGHDFDPRDIESIVVRFGAGARFVCEPADAKRRPRNVVDSQFSVPWAVAAMLVRGMAGPAEFSETAISDAGLIELASRIRCIEEPSLTSSTGVEAGRVDIILRDGTLLSRLEQSTVNDESGRVTFDQAIEKFTACTRGAAHLRHLPGLDELPDLIGRIDAFTDIAPIIQRAAPGAATT